MVASFVVVLAFVGMGVLNVVGYTLAARRRIKKNQLFGIRTRQTMRSPGAWYASQEAGWKMRLPLVAVYLVAAVVALSFWYGEGTTRFLLPVVAVAAVLDIVFAIVCVRVANSAAQRT